MNEKSDIKDITCSNKPFDFPNIGNKTIVLKATPANLNSYELATVLSWWTSNLRGYDRSNLEPYNRIQAITGLSISIDIKDIDCRECRHYGETSHGIFCWAKIDFECRFTLPASDLFDEAEYAGDSSDTLVKMKINDIVYDIGIAIKSTEPLELVEYLARCNIASIGKRLATITLKNGKTLHTIIDLEDAEDFVNGFIELTGEIQ